MIAQSDHVRETECAREEQPGAECLGNIAYAIPGWIILASSLMNLI
jgi:hypothetical protein